MGFSLRIVHNEQSYGGAALPTRHRVYFADFKGGTDGIVQVMDPGTGPLREFLTSGNESVSNSLLCF
ncbi:hypothetical protein Y032_0022g475 [Ancylostoma ceylanicum]|uniref:Uncharacterized protein n=1 Tax=Ancylostoma ceylanicum TaxID=53326 RepID=A0A016V093_9BILA|nr:hypothetical protein Y032_0022g475 [Ancylostoma ceylanicum]